MSMTAQNVLAWAAGEIGYTRWDDPEEGSKYGRWYAKRHGAYYGTSGVPFCAMGASWCATDNEDKSVLPGGDFAYVPYGINAAAREGRLVSPMTQAAPGDLVCFDWDDDDRHNERIGLKAKEEIVHVSFPSPRPRARR